MVEMKRKMELKMGMEVEIEGEFIGDVSATRELKM